MNRSTVKPLITEKTMTLAKNGWYAFASGISAGKTTIKQDIETLYGVTVIDVRSAVMPGKTRRVGKKGIAKTKSDWKKLFVRCKPGQTIDAFNIGGQQEKT